MGLAASNSRSLASLCSSLRSVNDLIGMILGLERISLNSASSTKRLILRGYTSLSWVGSSSLSMIYIILDSESVHHLRKPLQLPELPFGPGVQLADAPVVRYSERAFLLLELQLFYCVAPL